MRLRWRDLDCEHLHWRRALYRPDTGIGLHGHDFAECFLIEDGHGQQDLADEPEPLPLRAGDLVFIHPDQSHALRATGGSMILSNLAIPADRHRELHQRFFDGAADWPWSMTAATRPIHLRSVDRAALMDWLGEVERAPGAGDHALLAQALLCDLLRRAWRQHSEDPYATCPDWLRDAILIFDDPRHYAGGVQALARLAGVGREHLSRSIRRHLDCTATTLVNRLRLDHARTLLACTNRPIQAVSLDAGFGNLAHFHRVFKQHHGQTPGAYREAAARPVI